MQIDKDKYLPFLEQYLHSNGYEIKKDGQMRCPNNLAHNNQDKNFSAKLYRNDASGHARIKCFACGFDGDIYDVIGFDRNEKEFIKQYEIAESMYGNKPFPEKKEKKKQEKENPISLPIDKAKKIYTDENINRVRSFSKNELNKNGIIKGRWEYTDIDNNIIAADIRIEKDSAEPGKKSEKNVLTFWYNGKSLKMSNGPFLVYNLYNAIKGTGKDKPKLIHEGSKCAKIANKHFTKIENIAYNRGVQNSDKPDWSPFKNDKIYIIPDNDLAGIEAANKIKKKLPNAIILKSIYLHFEIDDIKAADIEQLLEQAKPEEIENYILSYTEAIGNDEISEKRPVCLGIDDNGYLYFIDRFQRLFNIRRNKAQKENLMVIAELKYWSLNYMSETGSIKWERATNDILTESSYIEFDNTKVRGRGAWRENDNFIYHDGKNTYGEISGEYMYVRKNKRDIGINENPIEFEKIRKLRELCDNISFAKQSDLIRLLAWSMISPFCGALRFRPGLLLTGESGSGKTTILEKIVIPISNGKHINTHYSSPAGIRAEVGNDSCAILLEEAEANQNVSDHDKNINRNTFFSMMRASSSDNAPEGIKSNSDQQVVKYSMKNMFLFVSITPTIAEIADDNRIFKVNFTTKTQKLNQRKWEEIEKELIELLNYNDCRRIRAYVWNKFSKIIKDTEIIIDVMKYEFKKSSRLADGESILISAYLNIFKNNPEINKENVTEFLKRYYKEVGEEEERDETSELLKRIFDEVIEITIDKDRKKVSIKECIDCLNSEDYETFYPNFSFYDNIDKVESEKLRINKIAEKEIKRILGHYGLSFQRDRTLAIANNNEKLKKILNRESGYAKLFHRHRNFVIQEDGKNDKVCFINNQSQRAVIINIYNDNQEYDPDLDDIPF